MKILVVNCGSSSLKYDLIEIDGENPEGGRALIGGKVERIGKPEATHITAKRGGRKTTEAGPFADHAAALEAALNAVLGVGEGMVKSLAEIGGVAHRVVHGGDRFHEPVLVTNEVRDAIAALSRLAPLHNPVNLAGIDGCRRLMPDTPHVAVFDTAFHRNLPRRAYLYALPYRFFEEKGIRRYGFHGPSHAYVTRKAAEHLGRPLAELKIVSCHLGNGASLAAVDRGRSIETSMGFTPLEGLVMGTRSGDLDPAVVLGLVREGLTADEAEAVLNNESGLKGISGVSNDLREIEEAAVAGSDRARAAVQVFAHRVKKYIGAYAAVLGGADAIVFTGGIGENSASIRARAVSRLQYMGAVLDQALNRAPRFGSDGVADVAAEESRVRILVVPTDEELEMATQARDIIRRAHELREAARTAPIPIGISAHHVHLSREHVEALFGPGRTLTPKSPLSQPGQFASVEQVDLVGPRGKVEKVRILGPTRKETQVEVSRTEEFKLGIDAPVRASGDLADTPGVKLVGTAGEVTLDHGVICALRHLHMAPADAERFGVKDKDFVRVRVGGIRPVVFGGVLVRASPDYALDMHIDTDEANAAELSAGATGFLEGIEASPGGA